MDSLLNESARPHPHPGMERVTWQSLDGEWEFSDGRSQTYGSPEEVTFDRKIQVPFSPETEASGIHDTGFYMAVWYRRTWESSPLGPTKRLLVHFEAVDWRATVWVNGKRICTHEGGYTPFSADITDALVEGSVQELVVRAEDDPSDLAKPRGKQDWKLEPHSIWYPRTTGIWQTVWLETVNAARVHSLHWSSSLDRWEIGIEAMILGQDDESSTEKHPRINAGQLPPEQLLLSVCLTVGEQLIAQDTYTVIAGEVHRRIALSDPGIDDFRNTILWSPASPTLIQAKVELRSREGKLLDELRSYTALRAIAVQGDRFLLNSRPLPLRLVLDQGYWPKTGLTAPNEEALRKDIELVKQLGFNGVRKHQKIESSRFLYLADKMGLLVWEEMPSAYRYTTKSIGRLTREWLEVIQRDRSHPCIVAWVPFNESWGVPDLPESPAQRHYVQSLYHLTKAMDPSRPVIGNDGWESVATDIIGIHDYDDKPSRIGSRYGGNEDESRLLNRERPGGRLLQVGEQDPNCRHPIMLTEFGGIAFGQRSGEAWGYSRAETSDEFLSRYRELMECVRGLSALAGFCYTQFTDTYQEINGLVAMDRTPKAPVKLIGEATSGLKPDQDPKLETAWRDTVMAQTLAG